MAATKVVVDFDYTPAEMIRVLEHAIATAAGIGTEYSLPGGRTWKAPSLEECRKMLGYYTARLAETNGRAVNYVRLSN